MSILLIQKKEVQFDNFYKRNQIPMDEMSTIRMCYTNKKYSKQNVFGFLTTTLCFSVRDEETDGSFLCYISGEEKDFLQN